MRNEGRGHWAGAAACVFVLAGCGEETPPPAVCLPEPTLVCVMQVAIEAAAPVMADRAQRDFLALSADPLLDLAKAVNKAGDAKAMAWMADQAQLLPNALNAWSAARVLAATGQRDAALALVKRKIAEDEDERKTRMAGGQVGSRPLSPFVELYVELGAAEDARALLKAWIERETPSVARLSADKRATYLGDAARAFAATGDTTAARSYADQAAAALAEVPQAEGARLAGARDFATTLLKAGMPDAAAAVLQKALAEIAGADARASADARAPELQRLMLQAQRARKNAAGIEAARAGLRALREKAAAERSLASYSSLEFYLMEDFWAALAAGDREEAQRIRDEFLAILARAPQDEAKLESAFGYAAEMKAVFGDAEGALAMLRRIKDDPADWKIPALVAKICQTLSDNGHVADALRCAARLTDRRPLYLQRRLETYAKIAADLAR
jgi:hypothetical protein